MLLARSNLEFASDDLKDFSEVVELNRHRLQTGDMSEADFLKIALQKLQVEQDVSAAQVALVQARANLRQMLGYESVAEDFEVAGQLERRPYAVTLDQVTQEALASRPDLQAAAINTRLSANTVALAHADRARDVTGEVEVPTAAAPSTRSGSASQSTCRSTTATRERSRAARWDSNGKR